MPRVVVLVLLALAAAAQAVAQTAPDPVLQGPPAPVPPAVITRDADGRVTIRAIHVDRLTFDGRLDEAVYEQVPSFGDFVQQEPHEGAPASDRTEVWVLFDANNLYVAARLWEADPTKRVATEMRRDANDLYSDDHFGVSFDTFYDRRNGYGFAVNSLGGMLDWSITNEQPNNNWNGIWDARTASFEHGWTIEIQFPFRSFRHSEGGHVWGMNFRRFVRADNELTYLAPVLASWGRPAMSKMSAAATVVGLDTGPRLKNLDAKAYGLGSMLTDRAAAPTFSNRPDWNTGLDVKWGIRQTLIADFTVNTDFAQVEDDEQQINLTRFSLFFPEKREFFLEGADTFAFGSNSSSPSGSAPLLFYSRQIGLSNGLAVPIRGGARVLGRSGRWSFGGLDIETGDSTEAATPATNFSVGRVNYDLLSRSRVGAMITRRDPVASTGIAATGTSNLAYGADAVLNPTREITVLGYAARTNTPGLRGEDASYRGRFSWSADRYGLTADYLAVGANFKPQVGLVRRSAFRQSQASARFSPRPGWRGVRKISYEVDETYLTDFDNAPESKSLQGTVGLDFENSDGISFGVSRDFERLDTPFNLGGSVAVPVGQYAFAHWAASYTLGQQHRVSGTLSTDSGHYYDGTLTTVAWTGRIGLSRQLYAEPTISWNRVRVPEGPADTNLASSRITYTISPRMFTSALIQYQSRTHTITSNARLRWEYRPGSELFIVYSDGRNTLHRGFPELANRSFVVKVTRLFRW
jgi:Domain of unknown function (DUF5916)/Carbohydrate family 9 binding domain-like